MPAGMDLFHFEPGEEDYSTAETETELIVSDAGAVGTDTVETRPAILISRGPFAYGNVSLDQLLEQDLASGNRTHTDLLSGSFVVNCVSKIGLEAEKLALLVAKAIRMYRRQLQVAGFFYIGHMIQVGQESPAGTLVSGDSEEDFVTVSVTFPVYYQESWTVTQDAETLARIRFIVAHLARKMDGSLVYPDSVDDNGDPIEGADGVILTTWTYPEES